MIYLDNAATTYPKPPEVAAAMVRALRSFGANPGRSGHRMSLEAAEEVYRCRKAASDFFHAGGPERVVFTLNCTEAINLVLKGLLRPGDHVVTSCLEHNAVMRPLRALEALGVTHTEARVFPGDNDRTLDEFRRSLRPNTALVICTHASNVWGIRLPIERICALAKEYGIPMAVDAAQSAGVLPLDMEDFGIDYLCCAGHKGLYGPMGTGMLLTARGSGLVPLTEGGTGTGSASYDQPDTMPDRLESGTPNLPGIAGLRAGIEFVRGRGREKILLHEMRLLGALYDRLKTVKKVVLYTPRPEAESFAPVLSFNVEGMHSELAGRLLSQRGVAVRAGLHCAPAAHRFLGTLEGGGAVRVCPSAFSNMSEISAFVLDLMKIIPK